MEFWRFLDPTKLGEPLAGSYHPGLVLLSVAIASLAAFCALAVVDRVIASSHENKRKWLIAGAGAMGCGIWAMHFTGMLAFRLPVAMACAPRMTMVSMVPGILGAGCALYVMSVPSIGWRRLQLGALLLAVGIGTMHYTGMEAMRLDAVMGYNPALFSLSIVVAHVLSTIALNVRFAFQSSGRVSSWVRPAGAVIMGTAVAGMHYTAMTAASFYPALQHSPMTMNMGMGMSHVALAGLICGVVALILGLTFIGTIVDARLSKAATDILEAAARHAAVVAQMADGLVVIDDVGRIESFNPSATLMFGYDEDEAVGRNVRSLMPEPYSSQHDGYLERYRLTQESRIMGHGREVEGKRKDGSTFPLELMVSRMTIGDRVLFSGVIRDLSQRRALESQLRQAQKLESIGQLAAGIAHEINTPAQYVGDNTRFLQEAFGDLLSLTGTIAELLAAEPGEPIAPDLLGRVREAMEKADMGYLNEEIPRAIGQSLEGIERVSKIVRAMKEFSHPGGADKQAVDLNRAIESTITVASNEWKYVAEMVTDFDPNLTSVPCLPGDFNQVILNIIVNASHAIGDVVADGENGKGSITVRTRQTAEWAEIDIVDTGAGMPAHVRDKVFDPFFTTKEVGRGTGQGLSIAHAVIVQKHGGTIAVTSEVGKGTTFKICLPLVDSDKLTEEVTA